MDRINSLTADLIAGRITCGAYADAVYAAQHGADVSSAPGERVLTNAADMARADAFAAECEARGIRTKF